MEDTDTEGRERIEQRRALREVNARAAVMSDEEIELHAAHAAETVKLTLRQRRAVAELQKAKALEARAKEAEKAE